MLTGRLRSTEGCPVRSCRSWPADRRPSGRVGGWGANHPSHLVRGGRSAPRERIRKGPGPLDNFPTSAAGRSRVGPKGAGSFRSSAGAPRVRRRLAPRTAGYGPVLLRTLVALVARRRPLAGLRAGRRAPSLVPFAGRPASCWPSGAARRAAPGGRAWSSGSASSSPCSCWMRAVGHRRLDRAVERRGRCSTPLLGPVTAVPGPAPAVAAVGRRRLGGDGGDPQHLAVQRDAVGPAGLRRRRHPGRRRAAVRRRHRRQLPAGAARGRCWPGWCVARGRARLRRGRRAGRRAGAGRRRRRSRRTPPTDGRRRHRGRGAGRRAGQRRRHPLRLPPGHRRTTSTPPSSWPPTSPPARAPRPDFVVWPENSTAVDPFRDAADQRRDPGRASAAIGVPILVGAIVDARARARAQPGHRLGPGHRRGGPLHQVAPGAVRRVHPVRAGFFGSHLGQLDA